MKLECATHIPWTPAGPADRRVAVLMSGGVDSSVTALLLQRDGWDVAGVTMRIPFLADCDAGRSCCGVEAARVCSELSIPHYFADTREEFRRFVLEPFRRAYADGQTPSPCVDCNSALKFAMVWDLLEKEMGASKLATGHYAQVVERDGDALLARAADVSRDQSYFLYGIARRRLRNLLLPVGAYSKKEVRSIARAANLLAARKPDSMELCFAGEEDYRRALGPGSGTPGPIYDTEGREVGRHTGIAHYTVGQRKGIGVSAPRPLYVIAVRPADNSVRVGSKAEAYRREVTVSDFNVLVPGAVAAGARLNAKIRSTTPPSPCEIVSVESGFLKIRFAEPQWAPAPGQAAVLYSDDGVVVGGGRIVLDDMILEKGSGPN